MIKVLISADSKYPVDRKRIRKLVQEFLKEQGVRAGVGVGVAIVGDRKMKVLNEQYMKHEGTTDVLSFPEVGPAFVKGPLESSGFVEPTEIGDHLGDLVVSWPQAMKQAMERNIMVDDEVDFLIRHGLLHLLGVHHD